MFTVGVRVEEWGFYENYAKIEVIPSGHSVSGSLNTPPQSMAVFDPRVPSWLA
jgi:hypothetical protein